MELKIDGDKKQPLKLGNFPISNTICLFDENLLVDPTDEEEELSGTTNITVVLTPGDFTNFFFKFLFSIHMYFQSSKGISETVAEFIANFLIRIVTKRGQKFILEYNFKNKNSDDFYVIQF